MEEIFVRTGESAVMKAGRNVVLFPLSVFVVKCPTGKEFVEMLLAIVGKIDQ